MHSPSEKSELMRRQHVSGTILLLGGLLLVWAYAISMSLPAVGVFHDDGLYVVTARALAEGQGYRIISLPESPPQTKYPILFPWLLSLIWRIAPAFPGNVPLLRIVPVASTVVWLWLSYLLLLKCGARRTAATTVVALIAASPWVLFLGTSLLSETLFAALLTGSLLLLTRVHEGAAPTLRTCAMAGLLAGACFLTRTAGIAAVAAGFAWLLMNRRRVGAVVFAAAAASLVIPWALWVLSHTGADADPYYSASNYGSWNIVFHYGWREKLEVVTGNVFYSLSAPLAFWAISGRMWLLIPAALLAACVCRGLWLTRSHPVTWFATVYTAMIMMWVWPPTRFFVPLIPLFLWQVVVAIRRVPVIPVAVVVAAVMFMSSAALLRSVTHARTDGVLWPRADYAEDWHRLSALFDWIRRETPPDAVLTGNLDPTYFLYADRKGIRAFAADPYALFYPAGDRALAPLGSVSDFRRRLLDAGVDYCVWSPALGFGESPHFRHLLDELSRDFPGSLTIATGDVAGGYVVYRIDRAKLADAERRQAS
jgi:hypothetical protein